MAKNLKIRASTRLAAARGATLALVVLAVLAGCSSDSTKYARASTTTTTTTAPSITVPAVTAVTVAAYTPTDLHDRYMEVTVATADQAQLEAIVADIAPKYASFDSLMIFFHCNGAPPQMAKATIAYTSKGGAQTGTQKGDRIVTVQPDAVC